MKRQSISNLIADVTRRSGTLARFGFADIVAADLRRAYRIGLNNGKLLAQKKRRAQRSGS